MTIYAIVNHLLAPLPVRRFSEPVWTIISQAAILQGGNPFFVPDFASRFEARPALAVRIGKLGKGIAPRFANRYVEAVAPSVVFVAADRLDALMEEGMPWTSAISYDRSLALGKFQPMQFDEISSCGCSLRLIMDESYEECSIAPFRKGPSLEDTIAAISRDNTLKTGDILLIGLSGSGPEVKPGCRALLSIAGRESPGFNIR